MTAAIDTLRQKQDKVSAALRTVFNITARWGLDNEQVRVLLGSPSRAQFHRLKNREARSVPRDTAERVSYILGIQKSLRILFTDDNVADSWIHRPNRHPLFAGRPAVERMLAGNVEDLALVRRYLDAERG